MKVANILSLSIPLLISSSATLANAATESYPGEEKNRNDPEQQPNAHSPETYALSAADQKAVVDEHNAKRALHVDTPPLTWDDTLAQFAEKLAAEYPCYSGELHHSGADYGENLALGYTATGAVDGWYNEIKSYNYSSDAIQPATGHFTQVVWRDSKKVGCAIRYCNSYWGNYMICEYDPSGNYLGEFADNVMPLKVSLGGDGSSSAVSSASATASASASASADATSAVSVSTKSSSLGTAVYSQTSRLYGNSTTKSSTVLASDKSRTTSITASTTNTASHGSSMAASTKGNAITTATNANNNGNANGNRNGATTTVQDNVASKTGDTVLKIRTVYTTNGVVVTTYTTYCPESDKTTQTPVPQQTVSKKAEAPAATGPVTITITTCDAAGNTVTITTTSCDATDVVPAATTTTATVAKAQDVEKTNAAAPTTTTTISPVAKGQDAEKTTAPAANGQDAEKTTATANTVTKTLQGNVTPTAPQVEQQTVAKGSTQSTSVSEAHVGVNTESIQAFEGLASNMNPNFLLSAIAMIFMSLL